MADVIEDMARAICWRSQVAALFTAEPDEAGIAFIDVRWPDHAGHAAAALEAALASGEIIRVTPELRALMDAAKAYDNDGDRLPSIDTRRSDALRAVRAYARSLPKEPS